ncbi:MAG: DUF2344 domain-containing protein [Actinomycetia bacterium]|nr:DUF2344 domain-containing protein [Actinomycetes bacterium]
MTGNSILRIRYSKLGKIRFTSHRDVARIWERTLRRVGIPVVFSEGFSPRPRLGFGLALPTGYESAGEYLDIIVSPSSEGDGMFDGVGYASGRRFDVDQLPDLLSRALPEGIDVQAVEVLTTRGESLQEQVVRCGWAFEIAGLDPHLARERVKEVLDLLSLPTTREHKGAVRTDDLRPAITRLVVVGPGDWGTWLEADLSAKPRVVRPSELVQVLAPDGELVHARRTHQWKEQAGAHQEPISCDATLAPHAMVRVL